MLSPLFELEGQLPGTLNPAGASPRRVWSPDRHGDAHETVSSEQESIPSAWHLGQEQSGSTRHVLQCSGAAIVTRRCKVDHWRMPVGRGNADADEFMLAVNGWGILGSWCPANHLLQWLARTVLLISYPRWECGSRGPRSALGQPRPGRVSSRRRADRTNQKILQSTSALPYSAWHGGPDLSQCW